MHLRLWLLAAGCLLLASGCEKNAFPIAPASGRVIFNGKPLAGAHLLFQPVPAAGQIEAGPESVGETDAEGRFTLTTIEPESKGATVGKHRVSVTIQEEENRFGGGGEDGATAEPANYTLPQRYRLGTELVVEIPPDGTDQLELALTSP
jgi:hypothetical protein